MNWLDIVLLLLIAGAGILGMVRGSGRTTLDALALYGALFAAGALAVPLAARISFHAGGMGVNQSWAFGLLFVLFGAAALGLAWYVNGMTQFNMGMFDKLFGLIAGVALGMIVAHGLTASLVMADPQRIGNGALVADGAVGGELYSFGSYHAVINTLTGATSYHRELAGMGGK